MAICKLFFILALIASAALAFECPPERPHQCGNHACEKSKSDCQASEGCTNPTKPYYCSDGQCAKNFRKCEYKFYPCPRLTDRKCGDGVCRTNCDGFHSSACSFHKPIRCSDGTCSDSLIECASYLCPGDAPYRCKNNECVENLESCAYPLNIYVAKTQLVDTTNAATSVPLRSQGGEALADLYIPAGNLIQIRGVAMSQVKTSKAMANSQHDVVYNAFYALNSTDLTPNQLIRSAIFEVNNLREPVDPNVPRPKLGLEIKIKVDMLKPLRAFEKITFGNVYCLAQLVDSRWQCVSDSRAISHRKAGEFLIQRPGIYATIFFPDGSTPSHPVGAYCGYLCQSKRYFFVFWFLFVPILLMTGYILLNLLNLQTQVHNVITENFFLQNKMDELENVQVDFTGQTVLEKLDEGVQYFTNPLRNEEQESIEEFKALNLKLQLIKEEAKKVNMTRNKLINSNKAKLEEIKGLRGRLGEYA